MKLRLTLAMAAGLAALAAPPAAAQGAMIAQGMTPAQVRDVIGSPARVRESGEWTYWYYSNGCPIRCGSDDVVFFRGDRVVTAVMRTGRRQVSGPTPATALERAGGDIDADAIRAGAGETAPAPAQRIRVQGRSRADAEAEEAAGAAHVGRIRVESGGRVIERETVGQVRDTPAEGESTIIRTPANPPGAAGVRRGVSNPPGTASDSAQGAPATSVDDERAAREGEVRRNTVPQTDTTQARRLNREKSVTPRVVPRP
jgi:hypothetical protein